MIDFPSRRNRPAFERFFIRQLAVAALFLLPATTRGDFLRGADLSALERVEDHGGVFTEGGIPRDPVDLLESRGMNAVRLRLWHTPKSGYDDLQSTIDSAVRVRSAGLRLLLDIHYSETWADPGAQRKPAAWEVLPFAALKDSVYEYTRAVIGRLDARNALPDMVQIGNEISAGFLWDDGRVGGAFDGMVHWHRFGELLKEGIRGVKDGASAPVEIMIHYDRGGDNAGSRYFFDKVAAEEVPFDVIGLSFYPWWHGTLADLASNMNDLAERYGRGIVLAEAAYPWSLAWADTTHNIVGLPKQLLAGYPATAAGQRAYLVALVDTLRAVRADACRGWFYWAPEWLADPTAGSPWENVTLFDFDGEILAGADALGAAWTAPGIPEAEETPGGEASDRAR